ncbi:MAG: TatD family hydrolase [Firmicutes bacterium]|nr:TatD family hydrolase [Bacillota bacterium]
MLIDSHAHIQDPQLRPDLEGVLERAHQARVGAIVCPGYDLQSSSAAIEIADQHPQVVAAVGIHPNYLEDWRPDSLVQLADWAQHPRVVALGEMGLDYVNGPRDKKLQQEVFIRQLELAGKAGLPAIIHNRESHADVLKIVREVGPLPRGGVMHCYSGSAELAAEFIDLGYYISFAGPVTFKNARRLSQVAAAISPEWLLCETDSPYLSPEPFRGRRNEPARVVFVAERLAQLQNYPPEELASVMTANAKKLFGI